LLSINIFDACQMLWSDAVTGTRYSTLHPDGGGILLDRTSPRSLTSTSHLPTSSM
jgi:hypothetical protein